MSRIVVRQQLLSKDNERVEDERLLKEAPCYTDDEFELVIINSMKDLTNPVWIKFKGILFLLLGLLSAILLYAGERSLRTAVLLLISIWSFCRFYYFAFYVIEHYVDPGYRYSGLFSFARYMFSKQRQGPEQ